MRRCLELLAASDASSPSHWIDAEASTETLPKLSARETLPRARGHVNDRHIAEWSVMGQ
jgi:hypothetical protein